MKTETEFLLLRARQAKQRMQRTASEMVNGVLVPLEVRPLVRRHPWKSLGAALLGGIVTGAALRPGRKHRGAAREQAGLFDRLARTFHRGGRVLRSALGAMVVANLREAAKATTPPSNGAASPS